tara:strand:+ start:12110 stop:12328 length:219 start_codon:yes stop_codon:yes gene_type:complete
MIPKRTLRKLHPKLRDYLIELDALGYVVESGRTHHTLRCPEGHRVGTLSLSPSDHRTQLNTLSDIRRTITED